MDISEETALLPVVDSQQDAPRNPTPLPKLQLAVLCATRLMDPLTFTQVSPVLLANHANHLHHCCQIYPYINKLLSSLNIAPDGSQIGLYSGLVVRPICHRDVFSNTCPGIKFRLLSTSCGISVGSNIRSATYQRSIELPNKQRLDIVGRRPVIVIGTAGLAISTIILGLTSTLPQILIARCLGAQCFLDP
jgi:hypothetical protein